MTLKPLRTSSPALIMVSSCCPWGVYILEVDLWICAEWKQTPTSSSSFFQGIGRTRRKTSTVLPSIIKLPLSKTTFLLVKITLSLFALCSVPVDETQKTDVLLKYDQICCIYLSIITPIFSSLPLYPPSFSHVISPSPWRPRGRANTGSCWPASSTSMAELVEHYKKAPIFTSEHGEKLYLVRPLPWPLTLCQMIFNSLRGSKVALKMIMFHHNNSLFSVRTRFITRTEWNNNSAH